MITIHQFRKKYFFTEADAPPAGGAPPGAPPGGDLGGLGGSLGGGAGGATQTAITDIKKLNAWDLLEKYFKDKVKQKDPLEAYL